MLEEHAGDADDGPPEVVVVALVEVLHQAVGVVGAGRAIEITPIVPLDLLLNLLFGLLELLVPVISFPLSGGGLLVVLLFAEGLFVGDF